MNLARIKDSSDMGTFTVGNLNDYINVLNKVNPTGNSELTSDDFEQLEEFFPLGTELSYRVMSNEDIKASFTLQVNNSQYLNLYVD